MWVWARLVQCGEIVTEGQERDGGGASAEYCQHSMYWGPWSCSPLHLPGRGRVRGHRLWTQSAGIWKHLVQFGGHYAAVVHWSRVQDGTRAVSATGGYSFKPPPWAHNSTVGYYSIMQWQIHCRTGRCHSFEILVRMWTLCRLLLCVWLGIMHEVSPLGSNCWIGLLRVTF